MNTRIRSSLIGGVFGFAIALISGGFAGILAGLVAGLINGFSVPQPSRSITGVVQCAKGWLPA